MSITLNENQVSVINGKKPDSLALIELIMKIVSEHCTHIGKSYMQNADRGNIDRVEKVKLGKLDTKGGRAVTIKFRVYTTSLKSESYFTGKVLSNVSLTVT